MSHADLQEPHMPTDPYTRIASEIREELAALLQQQDASAAGSNTAVSLQSALEGVDEQLIALEDAVEHMVASPSRFNLPLSVAYHRQAEVQQMRYQHQRLSRLSGGPAGPVAGPRSSTADSSSSMHGIQMSHLGTPAAKGPAAAGGGVAASTSKPYQAGWAGGGAPADTSWHYLRDQQQVMLQQQDEALEDISIHIGRIKDTGLAMQEELGEQDRLLGDLQSDADTSAMRLRGARARVQDVIRRARNNSQLLLIAFLTLVAIVLLILAVA